MGKETRRGSGATSGNKITMKAFDTSIYTDLMSPMRLVPLEKPQAHAYNYPSHTSSNTHHDRTGGGPKDEQSKQTSVMYSILLVLIVMTMILLFYITCQCAKDRPRKEEKKVSFIPRVREWA